MTESRRFLPIFGRYNLEVIEEQFGPIIRGIVEDRLLLERLPQPTSSASYLSIQQVTFVSYGVWSRTAGFLPRRPLPLASVLRWRVGRAPPVMASSVEALIPTRLLFCCLPAVYLYIHVTCVASDAYPPCPRRVCASLLTPAVLRREARAGSGRPPRQAHARLLGEA